MFNEYLLTSDLIKIRRTDIEDLEFVIRTEHDNENKSFITQWTIEQHIAALTNSDCLHLVIEDLSSNLVGYSIIFGLENKNANVELMRLAISQKGKGYGGKSIRLLQQFIFEHLEAHRLWLDVREHNERAKSLYERLGFQREGMLRECIKTTEGYQSLIIMGLLKNEYEAFKFNSKGD
ncbi:MAG: GNAT N-acetyltransferase [Paenibacillus sp.]|nr:GNAT N-acetyltransferase [Paenibacillus sp.]